MVVVLLLFSASTYWDYQMRAALKAVEYEHSVESLHVAEATQTLNDARLSQKLEEQKIMDLEKTKQVLEHELQMAELMKESNSSAESHNHHHISDYIERRQQVLQNKIESLRSYIQEESRREVLEK